MGISFLTLGLLDFVQAFQLTLQQVFILEGLPAIFCGIYTFFFLPDCELLVMSHCHIHSVLPLSFHGLATRAGLLQSNYFLMTVSEDPETAAFLLEPEKEAIIADLPSRAPSMESKTFETDQIKAMFRNPTFVPFLIIWITHGIGGFGITFVLPTVIYELGISDTAISQLMTMVSMTTLGVRGARCRLQLLTAPHTASICRSLPHPAHPGFPHPHEAAQPMGGRDRARGRADIFYILLITVNNATAKYIFVVIATAATQSFFPIIWPGEFCVTRTSAPFISQGARPRCMD